MPKRKAEGEAGAGPDAAVAVPAPEALWASQAPEVWAAALEAEGAAVAAAAAGALGKKKERLPELHAWFRGFSPATEGVCTKQELECLMDYKLVRGKMRPLMRFIKGLAPAQVAACTKEGLRLAAGAATNARGAVEALSKLKGVGAATASLILSSVHPAMYAFMSDEALVLVGSRKKTYTVDRYLEMNLALLQKAEEVNLQAAEVERALWTATVQSAQGGNKRMK